MEDLELCEQGGVAGPSRSELDDLLLQLFSTDVSVGAVFVTAFPTTAKKSKLQSTQVALHRLARSSPP